ncbi:MAG: DUF4491 family protein [Spirochaetales bacterium]|nr:DUF4491 family protein [Spirochaetales bacterium]
MGDLYFGGLIVGFSVFLITGLFHPIVIKGEYYFGVRIWPVFLLAGLLCVFLSLIIKQSIVSALLGVTGFTCFWSILELFEQRKRVAKGWFPENRKRKKGDSPSSPDFTEPCREE